MSVEPYLPKTVQKSLAEKNHMLLVLAAVGSANEAILSTLGAVLLVHTVYAAAGLYLSLQTAIERDCPWTETEDGPVGLIAHAEAGLVAASAADAHPGEHLSLKASQSLCAPRDYYHPRPCNRRGQAPHLGRSSIQVKLELLVAC